MSVSNILARAFLQGAAVTAGALSVYNPGNRSTLCKTTDAASTLACWHLVRACHPTLPAFLAAGITLGCARRVAASIGGKFFTV